MFQSDHEEDMLKCSQCGGFMEPNMAGNESLLVILEFGVGWRD